MEQRRQQLDLAATHAQLPHPAAVDDQPALLDGGVELEQRPQVADPARLDVDRPRRERHRVEIRRGGDRRVVGDAPGFAPHPLGDLRQLVGVLEQRVRERGDHAVVHRHERVLVLDRHPVAALEVDDLDRLGGHELRDQLVGPARMGVELEPEARVRLEPPADRVERRRIAEPERVDEPQRAALAPEQLVQRPPGLVEREIQGGRLEGPVAPAAGHVPLRRDRPLVDAGELVAERAERPLPGQGEGGPELVQRVRFILEGRHVLAEALRAAAVQADQGGDAREVVRERRGLALERVRLDRQRQRGEDAPGLGGGEHAGKCDVTAAPRTRATSG